MKIGRAILFINRYRLRQIFLFFLAFTACDKKLERGYARVETSPDFTVHDEGVEVKGRVYGTEAQNVIEYGFVYGEDRNPKIATATVLTVGVGNPNGEFEGFVTNELRTGVTFHFRAYASTSTITTYGQEYEFLSKGGAPPSISSFSPMDAVSGDTLYISGINFSAVSSANTVTFGSIQAYVPKSTTTEIRAVVPEDVPISPVDISVRYDGKTAIAAEKFTLTPMVVTGFSNNLVQLGEVVFVEGESLPSYKNYVRTEINGVTVPIDSIRNNRLYFTIPESLSANLDAYLISGEQRVKLDLRLAPPKLDSVEPEIVVPGQTIYITGSGFISGAFNEVWIGEESLGMTEASNTFIQIRIPEDLDLPSGSYDVTVSFSGNRSNSIAIELKNPKVGSVSTTSGKWRDVIAFSGTDLDASDDYVVEFDGTGKWLINTPNDGPDKVTVSIPDDVSGSKIMVKLWLYTDDEEVLLFSSPFILDPMEITSFSPSQGGAGEEVTIQGNFNPNKVNNYVLIGDYEAEVIESDGASLRIKLPLVNAIEIDPAGIRVSYNDMEAISSTVFQLLGVWRKKNDPLPTVCGACQTQFASLGSKVYYINSNVFEYDTDLDVWTDLGLTQLESQQISFSGVVGAVGDILYFGTGANSPLNFPSTFGSFDLNNFVDVASFPGFARFNATVASADGKVYVGLGELHGGGHASDWYHFEPGSNAWTKLTDFPGGERKGISTFVINDQIYLVAGRNSNNQSKDNTWVYDISNDEWNLTSSFHSAMAFGVGFSLNGFGYAGMGEMGLEKQTLFRYDPDSPGWDAFVEFPYAFTSAVSFSTENSAFVIVDGELFEFVPPLPD